MMLRSFALLGAVVTVVGHVTGTAGPAAPQDRVMPDAPLAAIAARAAGQPAPLWRLPLGATRVDVMTPAGAGRLLVGLRTDGRALPNAEYLLVRLDDGSVLWRIRREALGSSAPLLVLDDGVVLSTVSEKKCELSVVDTATGKERWKRSFKDEEVIARPAPAADRLLLERRSKDRVGVTALALTDGRDAWQAEYRQPAGGGAHPPLVWADATLVFYDGVTRRRLKDGSVAWSRPDLALAPDDPPPQVDGTELFVGRGPTIVALDLETGVTRWTSPADGYSTITNIYPDGATVYVRGIANEAGRQRMSGAGACGLSALGRTSGLPRWQRRTILPTISNFVRAGGRLFMATAEHVVALNDESGEQLLDVAVAPRARVYPVRLRAYPDRVVFIGEYTVVALDASSGVVRSRVGVTPLSQVTSLAGLDVSIQRLQGEIDLGRGLRGGGVSLSAMASSESARYQNLANHYRSESSSRQSSGDHLGAALADQQARMNSAFSRQESTVAFVTGIIELGQAIQQGMIKAKIATAQGVLEHQLLFRQSIVSGYALAETGDYVVRPDLTTRDGVDFAGVVILHMPTGRQRTAIVSASYENYGLWNLYDPDRGVLYHDGIGLDPSAYHWSDKHEVWPLGKQQTIETFLLATPVKQP